MREVCCRAAGIARHSTCVLAWLALYCSGLFSNAVFANDYAIAQTPNWVAPVELGKESSELLKQISDGAYFLLSDMQVRAAAASKVTYRRFATKAINAEGVQAIANIQIVFDPSYQKLILHSIDVVRDGTVGHRLATASVQVVQRERELERRIYDGSKTASIFLDDIRVGDVIDYSYSLEGRNPVFKGADFGAFSLQYVVPVGHVHARLLVPADQQVAVAPRNTTAQSAVRDESGFREHVWDLVDVPALRSEADTPTWYDPYPLVQWSEFQDWAAVASWARPLYQVPAELSQQLRAEIDRVGKSEATVEGRMLAVLQFVQTKVRYLGVEIGPGMHAPNPPSSVFARRFGDCKDKTLLTLTMLHGLGIDAQAALVNTQSRRLLNDLQPTPSSFDHVLVHAVVGGKPYWLDPTRSNQAGDLDHLFQPDYDYALLVDAKTHALTPMKSNRADWFAKQMRAEYDARSGFDKPVRFTMSTTVRGERAERMRYTLASSNSDEVQKKYLDYYAAYYPGIKTTAPMKVVDDAAKNTMTTSESYEIPEFASWSEKQKRHVAEIFVPDIDELLRAPSSTRRSAPLDVRHPVDIVHTTDVLLPDEWPIKEETTKVNDPAFDFERSIRKTGRRLTFTDKYQTRIDAVAPADVVRYANNLSKARNAIGYQLYWTDPAATQPGGFLAQINWPVTMLGLLALIGWIELARRAYRYDPPPSLGHANPALCGIRGWLLLPGLGTIVTPFVLMKTILDNGKAMQLDLWTILTSPGSEQYNALWAPTLVIELVANLGLLVFAILLAILFAKRRRSTPRVYIVFLIATIVVQVIDMVMVGFIKPQQEFANDIGALIRQCLSVALWSAYFLNSVRVRSTFTEGRLGTVQETAASSAELPSADASGEATADDKTPSEVEPAAATT